MNLIVSYHVLLKTKVSMNISSFPGCYKIVDYLIWLPNFTSTDMFLFSINASLKSYSLPKIELTVINPLDCFTILFFRYRALNYF